MTSGTPARKTLKKKRLTGTWSQEEVQRRIQEIVATLEHPETLSKSRRRLLYSKLARLRKAEKGECAVGGQLTKSSKRKIQKNKERSKPQLTVKGRWKECLCCRGKGHTMQECRKNPALAAEKKVLCFNCGETDHTLWTCPKEKQPDGSLPFASCFVCKEQGHLASKCPQNTTGIYPKGGGCHVCGSLYHLMKDCPNRQQSSADAKTTAPQACGAQPQPFVKAGRQKGEKTASKASTSLDDNDSYWMAT